MILERASYLPDMDVLQRDIEELAGYHRPIGSQGEKDAVEYLQKHMPAQGVTLWVATMDEELTSHSYIVPGLGDAGDLAYGDKK